MKNTTERTALYHLPGLFEFYELYKKFLPLWRTHREWFYDWCDIASIYGAPQDCLWGGGRTGLGNTHAEDVLALMNEYGISARLTFSNSLLKKEHLSDKKCNELCVKFSGDVESEISMLDAAVYGICRNNKETVHNGVIVHSDLLADYLLITCIMNSHIYILFLLQQK